MNRVNMRTKWLADEWQEVLWGLRDGEFMDQDSVNVLRRIREEIPEAVERGLENNKQSKLFKEVA